MEDHSHNWHDGATTKESINDSSNNVDTKKLKENIHAIQVSFKICEGAHLTKECPLKKEDKAIEPSKYIESLEETIIKYYDESIKKQATNDEWIRKFVENTDLNLRALDTTTKNLQVKADQLTQMVLTNARERVKAKAKMGKKDMKEPVPRDFLVVQPYVPPTPFPGHLKKLKDNLYKTRETICMIRSPEKIHKKKAHKDNEDMDDGWDIMIEDVERLRQILTPTIHTLPNLEPVVHSYMPLGLVSDKAKVTVHITPPDDDYVAPATNPILEKHLNEFGKEFFYMTRVDENGNFIEDIKELSIKTHVECETFIQILLNKVSQLPKSSNETGKTRREMKSHQRYSSNLSFPYLVENLRPRGDHCYSHSHLISSEGRNTLLLESHSKEMEFEVSSARNYVVKLLLSAAIMM
ncbi:hypothetical protein Tco_0201041 [Tanacetum coccineum]